MDDHEHFRPDHRHRWVHANGPCSALSAGLLLLRTTAGGFLLPHGLGKLFGWFGGPGLAGFAGELRGFGLAPLAQFPTPFLLAFAQTALGILILAGAWTRLAAATAAGFLGTTTALTLSTSMAWFWMDHGIEYPLFWTLVLLALVACGPGSYSVDCWRKQRAGHWADEIADA